MMPREIFTIFPTVSISFILSSTPTSTLMHVRKQKCEQNAVANKTSMEIKFQIPD
jgi:hypothetical protein